MKKPRKYAHIAIVAHIDGNDPYAMAYRNCTIADAYRRIRALLRKDYEEAAGHAYDGDVYVDTVVTSSTPIRFREGELFDLNLED